MSIEGTAESSVQERLQVRLIDGSSGKTVFDSEEGKPEIVYPDKPLKFCTNCGGDVQAIIYVCKGCGEQFMQTMDRKTGRVMTIQLPRKAKDATE